MKTTLTILATVAVMFVMSACGSGNEKPTLKKVDKSKSMTILRSDKSEDLDPHQTASGGDITVLSQMYESLTRPSSGTKGVVWEPSLATEFSANKERTEHTFKIRKGVKFHDGAKLDANAVKVSLDRLLIADSPAAPTIRKFIDFYSNIENVKIVDDYTILITTKKPDPLLVANMGIHAAMIVSPKAIKHMATLKTGAERSSWLTKNPAGTGPFTIKSSGDYKNNGTNITISAFTDYWNGAPKLDRITFVTQTEVRQRTQRLINADIDMTDNLDPGNWDEINNNKDLNLYTWPGMNLCYFSMNVSAHATASREVREAIALAIDRAPFIAKFKNHAVAQHVLIPPSALGFSSYMPPSDKMERSEAIKKAKAIISKAGLEGMELKMLLPEVPRPYLLYPPEFADLITQQLAVIGLKVVLVQSPMKELESRIASNEYAFVLLGWMADTFDPDNFYRSLLGGTADGKPSSLNGARFYDKETISRMNAAAIEPDQAKRQKMYEELEKFVFETHRPMVPLISAERSFAWNNRVKGIEIDTTGTYHLHKAYIEE